MKKKSTEENFHINDYTNIQSKFQTKITYKNSIKILICLVQVAQLQLDVYVMYITVPY
jgi:hypothetical protein